MRDRFRVADAIETTTLPWGTRRWVSHPPSTGTAQLTVIEASFAPGEAHGFHYHPGQEEVIYVLAGRIEQWVDRETRVLGPGDAAFIPADVVHASFNTSAEPATILAILGPAVGAEGYGVVEVADQQPWASLRR